MELASDIEAGTKLEFIALSISSVESLALPDGDEEPIYARDLRPVWFNSNSVMGNPNEDENVIYPLKERFSTGIASWL